MPVTTVVVALGSVPVPWAPVVAGLLVMGPLARGAGAVGGLRDAFANTRTRRTPDTGTNDGTGFPPDRLAHCSACGATDRATNDGTTLARAMGAHGGPRRATQCTADQRAVVSTHGLTNNRTGSGPRTTAQNRTDVVGMNRRREHCQTSRQHQCV